MTEANYLYCQIAVWWWSSLLCYLNWHLDIGANIWDMIGNHPDWECVSWWQCEHVRGEGGGAWYPGQCQVVLLLHKTYQGHKSWSLAGSTVLINFHHLRSAVLRCFLTSYCSRHSVLTQSSLSLEILFYILQQLQSWQQQKTDCQRGNSFIIYSDVLVWISRATPHMEK